MNFRLSDEQKFVRDNAREFLAGEAPMERVRATLDGGGFDAALWGRIAELGWLGLVVPEALGGAGLGLVELGLIAEQLGASLVPLPVLSTALAAYIVATSRELGDARLVAELVAGKARAALVPLEPPGGHKSELDARWDGDDLVLDGVRRLVPDGNVATVFVDAIEPAGQSGRLFPFALRRDGSVQVDELPSLDPTRGMADVYMRDAHVRPTSRLDESTFRRAHDAMIAVQSAELVGIGVRVLELAVAYASERRQFGRVIGSFQAVKHACADMKLLVENAWSLAYYSLWAWSLDSTESVRAVAMAKAYCGPAIVRTAEMALQVFGGVGYTWETDIHLYLKRALVTASRYGDADFHRDRLCSVLD